MNPMRLAGGPRSELQLNRRGDISRTGLKGGIGDDQFVVV